MEAEEMGALETILQTICRMMMMTMIGLRIRRKSSFKALEGYCLENFMRLDFH
jgi:hypothetical protein